MTARYLEAQQLLVHTVGNGLDAVPTALRIRPDVVILDVMLPGLDGMEICRRLRARMDVSIVMVTARADEADRVTALEDGADDYVIKPASLRELLARIRAHTRRARGSARDEVLYVGSLRLDGSARHATLAGRELVLTTYEFELLRVLAARPGRALSREQILELVRGNADEAFDRSIDAHVSRLRHKLGDDPRRPRMLKTIRGVGYMLTAA